MEIIKIYHATTNCQPRKAGYEMWLLEEKVIHHERNTDSPSMQ
jgi:hypothetical protein